MAGIRVVFIPEPTMAKTVQCWATGSVAGPLFAGFIRHDEEAGAFVARTRPLTLTHPPEVATLTSRSAAAAWLLIEVGFATQPRREVAA